MIKRKYISIGFIIITVYAILTGFGTNWRNSDSILAYLNICLLIYSPLIFLIALNKIFKILKINNQRFINIFRIILYVTYILYILLFGIITGFDIYFSLQTMNF